MKFNSFTVGKQFNIWEVQQKQQQHPKNNTKKKLTRIH